MKINKEVLYVPVFLIFIYFLEIFFISDNKDRSLHYSLEFLCLFLTGIFIGLENKIVIGCKWKIAFNIKRFVITFLPISLILLISFCISIGSLLGIEDIKLPHFIIPLVTTVMYKQVGMVLLGYFITSSLTFHIKAK